MRFVRWGGDFCAKGCDWAVVCMLDGWYGVLVVRQLGGMDLRGAVIGVLSGR